MSLKLKLASNFNKTKPTDVRFNVRQRAVPWQGINSSQQETKRKFIGDKRSTGLFVCRTAKANVVPRKLSPLSVGYRASTYVHTSDFNI